VAREALLTPGIKGQNKHEAECPFKHYALQRSPSLRPNWNLRKVEDLSYHAFSTRQFASPLCNSYALPSDCRCSCKTIFVFFNSSNTHGKVSFQFGDLISQVFSLIFRCPEKGGSNIFMPASCTITDDSLFVFRVPF